MKKVVVILLMLASVVCITACKKEEVKLDLSSVESKLDKLDNGKFSIVSLDVTSIKDFESELEFIYDFDYKKLFNINKDNINVDNSKVFYNKETKELLAVLNTKDETVIKNMDKFCDGIDNCSKYMFDGNVVYINSKDNDNVIDIVKNTKSKIFNNLVKADSNMLKNVIKIDDKLLDEYLIKVPAMITSADSYLIVKPVSGKKDDVKKALDKYMVSLEDQWKTYLPSQYELVKNREVVEYGDYLIYIISSDNDRVLKEIKGN